jgi:DNA polymerase-3 subunit gamma/tau
MLSCIEIDAASQTGVDNVRENIIENARFAPTRGKYKVFILDEVHMLSGSSFNALLKTLEEPPAHAMFILATTELHKIPATIASRCQRFEFHRVPPAVMMPRLAKIAAAESVTVDEEVLAHISRLSEGCLRDGESLLGQVIGLGESHITMEVASLVLPMTNLSLVVDVADAIGAGNTKVAIDAVNVFVRDGGSVKHFTEELIEYVRTVMLVTLGDTGGEAYDPKTLERLRSVAGLFGVDRSRKFLDALLTARTRLSMPALPQIPLEIAMMEMENGKWKMENQSKQILSDSEGSRASQLASAASAPIESIPAAPIEVAAPVPRFDFASTPVAVPAVIDTGSVTPIGEAAFSVEEIADKWERCCAYVAERNIALPLVLRNAVPLKVEGNVVTISCGYAFHADALKDIKARSLIEAAILDVLQKSVTVVSVYVPQKAQSDAVTSFISELGGNLA